MEWSWQSKHISVGGCKPLRVHNHTHKYPCDSMASTAHTQVEHQILARTRGHGESDRGGSGDDGGRSCDGDGGAAAGLGGGSSGGDSGDVAERHAMMVA